MSYEIQSPHPQGRPRTFDHGGALAMIQAGHRVPEVAQRYGVSMQAVRDAVRRYEHATGEKLPRTGRGPAPSVPTSVALQLLADAWSRADIARHFGCHPATVTRALRRQPEAVAA